MKNSKKPNWENRKNTLRNLIVNTFRETGFYVDYSFLMSETQTPYFPLISLLTQIAIDDANNNQPTADSLVTRSGEQIPNEGHFKFRVAKGFMNPDDDKNAYHNKMMLRWCQLLNIDFHRLNNTTPYKGKKARNNNRVKSHNPKPRIQFQIPGSLKKSFSAASKHPGGYSISELIRQANSRTN